MIEFDGIENYTFEILKEVSRPELCYWEDYFILKFNTFYPNGYNKKWNCNEDIRKEIQEEIQKEKLKELTLQKKQEELENSVFYDNEAWIEKYFDYRLFSLYCFLFKNSIRMNKKDIYVCRPYFTNRFIPNAIQKNISLSINTVKRYLEYFESIGIIKNDKLVEIKSITKIFNFDNFDSNDLLSNMLLWYILKENKYRNNFFFYRKDFSFTISKEKGRHKLHNKQNPIIELTLLKLKERKLISMKELTEKYGFEIIAL